MVEELDRIVLTEEQVKSRRSRNVAIALICAGMVVLFYLVTVVKIGPAILGRSM